MPRGWIKHQQKDIWIRNNRKSSIGNDEFLNIIVRIIGKTAIIEKEGHGLYEQTFKSYKLSKDFILEYMKKNTVKKLYRDTSTSKKIELPPKNHKIWIELYDIITQSNKGTPIMPFTDEYGSVNKRIINLYKRLIKNNKHPLNMTKLEILKSIQVINQIQPNGSTYTNIRVRK